VDARINLIVVDESTGERRNLTPHAWNATIQGRGHYLTIDDRVDGYYRNHNAASGISTVFWDGSTSTSNDVSNPQIAIDDIVLDEHPGYIFKWSQLAPYNEIDFDANIPWDWEGSASSVVVVNLVVKLPTL
jgi:hypothetical protein